MLGIDISNWQGDINLAADSSYFDFAIVKATEATNFIDPYLKKNIEKLKSLDKLIGLYHFARPDVDTTERAMMEEARWFVKAAESVDMVGKAILVLDWETQPINNVYLANVFLNEIEELTGVQPFIYCSSYYLSQPIFESIIKIYPVWLAQWPTIIQQPLSGAEEWAKEHLPSKDKVDWKIWQFTSTGSSDHYQGRLDLNYTEMSKENWNMYASTGCFEEREVISSDMQWAIDHKLFNGYPDGTYRPKSSLTREQSASLFRRFYDIFIGGK